LTLIFSRAYVVYIRLLSSELEFPSVRPSVRLSVCLSVTQTSCTKTTELSRDLLMPAANQGPEWHQKIDMSWYYARSCALI